MTYYELLNQIEKKKYYSAYFLSGKEDYLIEDALNRLLENLCDPATRDFNLDIFYGNEVDGVKLINTINAYPMLATSRVVVIKEFHKLSSSSLELLDKYLDNPASTTKLILLSTKVESGNKKIAKIKSKCCLVDCKPLYEREIPIWIRDHLKGKGYEISDEATLLIHTRLGNNLREIVNELEKIILNLDKRKKIVETDVHEVVAFSRRYTVFDLTNAIGNKDLSRSIFILNRMLQCGESPTGILAMITRHFVNLVKIKGAEAQRKSQNEISNMTGIPPFFIRKMKEMAKNFTQDQFNHIFEILLETDLSIKTSSQKSQIALETLLIRIIKNKR